MTTIDLSDAKAKHPNNNTTPLKYGTAGFRTKAELLECCAFRTGILAALRSKQKQKAIGVMITASHNPVEDNGMKIVDPQGEMLEMSWEEYATQLANASQDDLESAVENILKSNNIDGSSSGTVYIGMDTRPSSSGLAENCVAGVKAAGCDVKNYGVVTTPQLHYFVWSTNYLNSTESTEDCYYNRLINSFKKFITLTDSQPTGKVTVDGANGVGSSKAYEFQKRLAGLLNIEVKFDGTSGLLNYQCGADFVKTGQRSPVGLEMNSDERYASLDGDADRIVYYYQCSDGKFHLMDGDKIAILIAGYLKELLNKAELSQVKLGLVQTAYANGSSTKYISESLGVPVACACTGVKHLHHEALNFDIGVYFEANGHGTVLFSDQTEELINQAVSKSDEKSLAGRACRKLACLTKVINQCVGDALSDMLFVEAILADKKYSMNDWDSQYTDLPNQLKKVMVKDRQVIKVTDAERKTTSPPALQPLIDAEVLKYASGRSFVRPSGTEDCVRVYAEAATAQEVVELMYAVSCLVYDHAGGVGDRPAK